MRICFLLLSITLLLPFTCTKAITWTITTADQSQLLETKDVVLKFGNEKNTLPFIVVDENVKSQVVEGFGFSLTGGSAFAINKLEKTAKAALLNELFITIGLSFLRISIGASDLDAQVFSYDDLNPTVAEEDMSLDYFSLEPDKADLIPLLKEIVKIKPEIKILATPWSAPVWMKDNNSTIGGSLRAKYYSVYADYFVKYIQQMRAESINIDMVTPQNEPLNPNNNPSMYMTAAEESEFIYTSLGPAFARASIATKLISFDHNCDTPEYPMEVIASAAGQYVHGSAFHLYAGEIDALSDVHNAFPDKSIYFTEQWTGSETSFSEDLMWLSQFVIIGSMRNWARSALLWNLASDPSYQPHTPGNRIVYIDDGNLCLPIQQFI